MTMRHIELSRNIRVTDNSSDQRIQQALITRLQRAFMTRRLEEYDGGFRFEGTTGTPRGLVREARADITVNLMRKKESMRIFIHGNTHISRSLVIAYCVLFVMVLFAGLLPGSINTSGDGSDAMDALVFLIFGIFIFYDIEKKLLSAEERLAAALESVDNEFN